MKNAPLLPFLLLICALAACRKIQLPDLLPRPCADVVADAARLELDWFHTHAGIHSTPPIVFDQQVVFGLHLSADGTELISYDGATGQLLWQSAVPTPDYNEHYQQIGSMLYFTDEPKKALFSFDMATQQLKKVWSLSTPGSMSFQFPVRAGFAICPVVHFLPLLDSVELSAYLIDLQSGHSREVLRFRTGDAINDDAMLDPQITVNPAGDTLFCFVTNGYDQAFNSLTRFSSLNLSTGVRVESSALKSDYYKRSNNMVVEGNRAWFLTKSTLQCLDATLGTILWQADGDFEGCKLLVRGDRVFTFGYTRQAFDAVTGTALWGIYGYPYYGEDLQNSFVRDGQLWLPQEAHLKSIDLETGCITGDHAFLSGVGEGVYNMNVDTIGQRIYFSNHRDFSYTSFFAVPLPK